MKLDRFRAATVGDALNQVRRALGDDALVLRTRGRSGQVEVMATTATELYRFGASVRAKPRARPSGRRTLVVALVGPTGCGKTTTAAKLALSDRGLAGARVGFVSLDTYKIGAYEQIQTYADLAEIPLDIASEPAEARQALKRLSAFDVVIVDTPGRSPRQARNARWWDVLDALCPDETHLVLPATIQNGLAAAFLELHRRHGPTHLLLTKLDEVPGEEGVAEMAYALGLPCRWVTDGQEVPDDLHSAPERLVAALLGRTLSEWTVAVP